MEKRMYEKNYRGKIDRPEGGIYELSNSF